MNLPAIISLVITALSIVLLASLLHVNRIKCLLAAVLGSFLSNLLISVLAGIGIANGYLSLAITILCITLIAWLFGQHRVRSLLAVVLGVLLADFLNSLIMPLLNKIIGG